MNFLETPLSYTRDQRTSRDVCRDACYMTQYKHKMPLADKVLYCLAPIIVIVAIVFNQYGA